MKALVLRSLASIRPDSTVRIMWAVVLALVVTITILSVQAYGVRLKWSTGEFEMLPPSKVALPPP